MCELCIAKASRCTFSPSYKSFLKPGLIQSFMTLLRIFHFISYTHTHTHPITFLLSSTTPISNPEHLRKPQSTENFLLISYIDFKFIYIKLHTLWKVIHIAAYHIDTAKVHQLEIEQARESSCSFPTIFHPPTPGSYCSLLHSAWKEISLLIMDLGSVPAMREGEPKYSL